MEKRFYIETEPVLNNTFQLTGEEHIHLSKVLRLREGDAVECFYDGSNILNCKILQITKNSTTLQVVSSKPATSNPKTNVTLFQGLPKLDKLEFITQKVTELGISAITPFSSTFCIAKQNENKIERLKKIVVSACKQCGRTKLTNINEHLTFKKLIEELQNYTLVIFANETELSKTLKQVFSGAKKEQLEKVALVVGSEGGFSAEEITALTSLANVCSVTLGSRILRAETASVTLSALCLYELNEI